jgi:hypothetical protein
MEHTCAFEVFILAWYDGSVMAAKNVAVISCAIPLKVPCSSFPGNRLMRSSVTCTSSFQVLHLFFLLLLLLLLLPGCACSL